MGTDNSAAGQRRPRAPDDSDTDGQTGLRHLARHARAFGARLWRRVAVLYAVFVHACRRAVRAYLSGRGRTEPRQTLPSHADEQVYRLGPTRRPTDQAADVALSLSDESGDVSSRELPRPDSQARRLPTGDGRLQVERTPDRLTLSDPDDDDAYLSSTVWVEVEE